MKTLLAVMALLVIASCYKTTDPGIQLEYQLEIVPVSSLSISWDTTYYQHDATWRGFAPAADSFATVLKNSNLGVTDFWFPEADFECGIAMISGLEVIVKLEKPNDAVSSVHLKPREGYPLACNQTWRHYKYARK